MPRRTGHRRSRKIHIKVNPRDRRALLLLDKMFKASKTTINRKPSCPKGQVNPTEGSRFNPDGGQKETDLLAPN